MTAHADLEKALFDWVVRQRWFAGKGGVPRLRMLGSWEWHADEERTFRTHLVLDEGADRAALYQVPVAYRATPLQAVKAAYIGAGNDADGRDVHAYDATHDPGFADLLVHLILGEGRVGDERLSAHGVRAQDRSEEDRLGAGSRLLRSRVLTGEQSNTSIVCTLEASGAEREVICKVFRSLHHGDNPDVVLQSALSVSGSRSVPRVIGSVVGDWPDSGRSSGRARGHLVFAQEFLADARDAWQLARSEAASGRDFTASAREMGIRTAQVHSELAAALPTREATGDDVAAVGASWEDRLAAAVREVPELASLREPVEVLYEDARAASWPRLQRIHGDLHLGQFLSVPGQGWAIIDFEGEPMQPVAARSGVDLPLRDVAGMLRSFDYIAGGGEAPAVVSWAQACRNAFLDGYASRAGLDLQRTAALLNALELDKALYEAVYEARNRPSWLPIPVAAVRRLALHATRDDGD